MNEDREIIDLMLKEIAESDKMYCTSKNVKGRPVHVPWPVAENKINQVLSVSDPATDSFIVLDDIRLLCELLKQAGKNISVKFISPYPGKCTLASIMIGAKNVVQESIDKWSQRLKNKKDLITIGNPPYQDGNRAIWKAITKRIIKSSKVIGFITPRTIVNGEARSDDKVTASNLFEGFKSSGHFSYIDYSASKYFNVGKEISAWVYVKDQKGLTKIVSEDEKVYSADLSTYPYLCYRLKGLDLQIFSKLMKFEEKLQISSHPCDHYIAIPKSKHLSFNQIRIVSGNDPTLTAEQVLRVPIKENEILGASSFISSVMFRYMFYLFGGSDGMGGGFFRKFPKLDFGRLWTNAEIYAHFGLTQEEIEHITSIVK